MWSSLSAPGRGVVCLNGLALVAQVPQWPGASPLITVEPTVKSQLKPSCVISRPEQRVTQPRLARSLLSVQSSYDVTVARACAQHSDHQCTV
jgi:hypothetical protein